MAKPPAIPADCPAFAGLPVRLITLGAADEQMAVHVAGRLAPGRTPVLCLPGYNRNMSDFSAFAPLLARYLQRDWPVVLLDLRGRGRSSWRRRADDYSTLADARDVSIACRALGIESAIVVGQGHGGQVLMALALERPGLMAGAVLLDAGPAIAPQSLVRLRSNVAAIAQVKGQGGVTVMLRRMLAADYPGRDPETLDRLGARTHFINEKGALPLFDPALMERFADFSPDDIIEPQWPYFDLLNHLPLLLVRTQRTDQIDPEIWREMLARRPDARTLEIEGQGSPALLDGDTEVEEIADFVSVIVPAARERLARRA
jgi:pimeloyl-ACP methyl ester carboxylesterase